MPSPFQYASPLVLIASGTIETLTGVYSYATFVNDGAGSGTIDFGNGNVVPIAAGESLTMPYVGRPYNTTIVDGTLTTIKIIYVR